MFHRGVRPVHVRFKCGVCWQTSPSRDWNRLALFLGTLANDVATVCLPNKGLANTFHRRSSSRPLSDFPLVVSDAFGFVIVCVFGKSSAVL